MNMRYLLSLSVLLWCSCIDEFPIDSEIPSPQPVIEGLVADIPGESFVRISAKLGLQGLQPDPSALISKAEVQVEAGAGQFIFFSESSPGLYQPDREFFGTPEEDYILTVTLSDGRVFQSDRERMYSGVQIDSVFVNFREGFIPNTEQVTGVHNFFITVSAQSSGSGALFRTQSSGIAQVAAYIVPPPPGCSPDRCAEICYSYRRPVNREIVLGNTEGTNQNRLTLEVAAENYDFHSRYFLEVRTFSLSPQGYQFWSSLVNQQQIDGTIFDPQLAEIQGTNIRQTDTDEKIIGYFGASQITSDSLFFDRAESAGFLTPIPTAPNSCTEVWREATLDVPPQFQ